MKKILLSFIWLLFAGNCFAAALVQYVDTDVSGGDGSSWANAYASLSAWEAQNLNLTDNGGDTLTVYCRGTAADTTRVIIDGWITSATYTITIIGDFNGTYSTSKYRLALSAAVGSGLFIRDDYITVSNFQVIHAGTSGTADIGIEISDVFRTGITIKNSLIVGGYRGIITASDSASNTRTFINCILYDSYYTGISAASANAATAIYNCTVVDCGHGKANADSDGISNSTSTIIQNTIVYNSYAEDFNAASGSYNLSSDATASGTGSLINQSDPFVAYSSNNFHIAVGSNPIGAGTDLSGTFTNDIDGDTRSSWDIGADEYVSVTTTKLYIMVVE